MSRRTVVRAATRAGRRSGRPAGRWRPRTAAAGLSNEEIAGQIYVSPSTVKTHAARAMMKLGARDRAQLVVFAYEAGLVRPGWSG
jgi:hypothetical protein